MPLDPGQVAEFLQLPQRGPHCVPARAADGGQARRRVIPVLRKGEHDGQYGPCLKGQTVVPQRTVWQHREPVPGLDGDNCFSLAFYD